MRHYDESEKSCADESTIGEITAAMVGGVAECLAGQCFVVVFGVCVGLCGNLCCLSS